MDNYQKRIDAAFLAACSPQAAYDWLFERRIKDVYGYCECYDATLEYLLLRRNDPLIDLGIARFGHSDKGIKTVFLRGNTGIRCAALSNPHIGYTKCNHAIFGYGNPIVWNAARRGTKAEQESLTKNINLKDNVIEDLLLRKGLFANYSDDDYIYLLAWLGNNPRMKKTYRDTGKSIDGSQEYFYNRVFYMAWELAETLPATQDFAGALYQLLYGTIEVSSTEIQRFTICIRAMEN